MAKVTVLPVHRDGEPRRWKLNERASAQRGAGGARPSPLRQRPISTTPDEPAAQTETTPRPAAREPQGSSVD